MSINLLRTAAVESKEIDGVRFHYRRVGNGPNTLLFLHAWPLHGLMFGDVVAKLAGQHDCLVVDMPGLGLSPWPNNVQLTIPGIAERLGGLLERLGIASCVVVGNDSGGMIARYLALKHAKKIKGLFLTNTEIPQHRPPWIPLYKNLSAVPGYTALMQLLIKQPLFMRSPMGFGGVFYDLSRLKGTFNELFVAPLAANRERLKGALALLKQITDWPVLDALREEHKKITCPVVLAWGEDDPTFPLPYAQKMLASFGGPVSLRIQPKAKVFWPIEYPEVAAAWINDFLRELKQQTIVNAFTADKAADKALAEVSELKVS